MRYLIRGLLLSMIIAPAPAAETQGALAPGKAAGIQAAQSNTDLNEIGIISGIALAALAIYLIAGTHYNNPNSTTNTHP